MFSQLVSFILGGITIPLAALYLLANADFSNKSEHEEEETREVTTKWDRTPLLDFAKYGRGQTIVSGYVHISETFINTDAGSDEASASSTPSALSGSAGSSNTAQSKLQQLKTQQSRENLKTSTPQHPKTVSKLPKYWAEIRDGRLHLFSTRAPEKRRAIKLMALSEYVVSLWPLGAEDFELFYEKMSICLISRQSNQGVASLDLNPGEPPQDALFFYLENPTVKEDFYFALLQETRTKTPDLSLGPRDPIAMAQPLRAADEEWMELMNQVYTRPESVHFMWLNSLLGRLFLGVKDSKLVENYWHDKITDKLNRVNSTYFKEILVKGVDCGSNMPYITDVRLQSLTPDGELLLDFGVDYAGGFLVKIATQPDIQWLKNLLIEITVTLKSLKGRVLVRVKPPPSSRIWYAFESMPEMDLLIEPVVQNSRLNYSIITNTMSKLLQDVVKETMVLPVMDDISFYDTTGEFYRGGIWDHRKRGSQHEWHEGPRSEPGASSAATPSGLSTPTAPAQQSVSNVSLVSPPSTTSVVTTATADEDKTTRRSWFSRKRQSAGPSEEPPSTPTTPGTPITASPAPIAAVTPATVSVQQSANEPASAAAMAIAAAAGNSPAGSREILPPAASSASSATPSLGTSAVTAKPEQFEWSGEPAFESESSNTSIKSGKSLDSAPPIPPKRRGGPPKLAAVAPESERFN